MTPAPHRTEPHRLPWPFLVLTIAAVVYFNYGTHYPWWINALIGVACFAAAELLAAAHRFAKRKIAASRDADGSTGI